MEIIFCLQILSKHFSVIMIELDGFFFASWWEMEFDGPNNIWRESIHV